MVELVVLQSWPDGKPEWLARRELAQGVFDGITVKLLLLDESGMQEGYATQWMVAAPGTSGDALGGPVAVPLARLDSVAAACQQRRVLASEQPDIPDPLM